MHVFLTGGTGFIGRNLVEALLRRGDRCTVISRSGTDLWKRPEVEVIRHDPKLKGPWQRTVNGCDVVVNLAGERIVEPPLRWTAARKTRIRASRIATTNRLVDAILEAEQPPRLLLSGSAIGYYGPRGDQAVDESAPPGTDFLARLAAEWEEAARPACTKTRVALLRTGLVLGRDSPFLASLVPLFKLGLGGPWGDGKQWLSWIHIEDVVGIILFVIDRQLDGAFNLTAPNPVTVEQFARTLGKALGRPAILRAPSLLLRLALGEAADALLNLQRVLPARALEAGYQFRYPQLDGALSSSI
ncbi:MAG: epimerase [Gemmatimonadales bacterium]|nr:Epimerase family protein [bacterium HR33]GIW53196.1 MAG: epimerase [Gemmatimonadales bacterium]